MRCPHCNRIINNPDHCKAQRNAECFGSDGFTFRCKHCKKKYSFYVRVTAQICTAVKEEDAAKLSF